MEIIDEFIEVATKTCCESFWLHDVDGEPTKITCAVYDADPRAKNERRALGEHGTGELERCHRVRRWIIVAHPYLVHQLSVFYRLPTEGYTQGGKF
jgi:hypothetical protein